MSTENKTDLGESRRPALEMPSLSAESCLADLQAWIEFALQAVRYRAGKIPPTYTDGYSYVEVPEWSMRQKLDNVLTTLALIQPTPPSVTPESPSPSESGSAKVESFYITGHQPHRFGKDVGGYFEGFVVRKSDYDALLAQRDALYASLKEWVEGFRFYTPSTLEYDNAVLRARAALALVSPLEGKK